MPISLYFDLETVARTGTFVGHVLRHRSHKVDSHPPWSALFKRRGHIEHGCGTRVEWGAVVFQDQRDPLQADLDPQIKSAANSLVRFVALNGPEGGGTGGCQTLATVNVAPGQVRLPKLLTQRSAASSVPNGPRSRSLPSAIKTRTIVIVGLLLSKVHSLPNLNNLGRAKNSSTIFGTFFAAWSSILKTSRTGFIFSFVSHAAVPPIVQP
jgi:hypothetical protein